MKARLAFLLNSFVPQKNVSVAYGQWRYYAITVPAGAGELSIASAKGTGDADLFVRRGALPTLDTYDLKADASSGNDELAYLQNPTAGVWYVGVYGYADVAGLELEAHTQSIAEQVLVPGEAVTQSDGEGPTAFQ